MRRRWWISAFAICVIAGGIATLGYRRWAGPRLEPVVVTRGPLVQTLVTSGRVVQRQTSSLGTVSQTTVGEVLVEEGARVAAGDLLARFAEGEARAAVAEAEAAVDEAEARLRGIRTSGRRLAAETLDSARREAVQAEADYERQRVLFEGGVISEAAYERVRQQRDVTRSRRVMASLQVAQAAPSGSETALLAAALARAQARLRQAQAAFEHTQLRAPYAGTILSRTVEPGEVVGPGQVLFVLAGEGALEVRVTPDESNLARLALDRPALVSPEAFPNLRIPARVSRLARAVDPQRGTIDVVLTLEETNIELLPDMTVAAEIELGRSPSALSLPASVVRDLGTRAPWALVARVGRAERVEVTVGLEGDERVEIIEGLREGDLVVGPEAGLEPGDRLRLRSEPAGRAPEANAR